jgi:hypothetical protein
MFDVEALPSEIDTPLNWSDEEIEELEGTALHSNLLLPIILTVLRIFQEITYSYSKRF